MATDLLPWNKLIEFSEHLVNLNPVLEIFSRADVCPLVDHHPAHVGGTVFTG